VFAAIDALRIPAEYLANLFTAGNTETIRQVLRKLAAVRALMRAEQLGLDPDPGLPASVGADRADLEDLYRLLAIAKYGDRYVIPQAHAEDAGLLMSQHEQLFCSLDHEGGPGMGGTGPPASPSYRADDGRLHFNLSPKEGRS
jgi:nitrate reductase beta subunit